MTELKVVIPGRLHVGRWLSDAARGRLQEISKADAVNPSEVESVQAILQHDNFAVDDMGQAEVIGSPSEDLIDGRALILVGGVSVEVDAYDLTRALKPFVRRPPR